MFDQLLVSTALHKSILLLAPILASMVLGATFSFFGFGSNKGPEPHKDAIRALPSNWYTSPEMYELERRAIFSRKWLLITHKLRFANTGDFLTYTVAGFDFVLIKDRKGAINAFHNVCRHRAYPVVEKKEGTAKILACRYHGWSYGLDGKLAKAPGYQSIPGFDKTQNSLFPIHVHIDKNGFVWVNLDGKETPEVPWNEDFHGVDTSDRLSEFNFEDYKFDHIWDIDANYNWKIAADNYNECYHCPSTHPDLQDLADLESYDVQPKGGHIDHDAATTEEQRQAGFRVASTYYFPNASMNVTPNFFFIQKFMPTSPTTTFVRYEVYRSKYASDDAFEKIDAAYNRVMNEDKVLCNLAQKNLNAGVFVNGELHPKMEKGPLYFQSQVRDCVTDHHRKEKKSGGEIWPARQNLPQNQRAQVSQADVEFCSGLACGTQKEALVW